MLCSAVKQTLFLARRFDRFAHLTAIAVVRGWLLRYCQIRTSGSESFGLVPFVAGHSPLDNNSNNNISLQPVCNVVRCRALTLINGGPCPGGAHG